MIDTVLGPYRVLDKLGEGGMGEVWRAIDTRLEREVAIKVLPAAFTEDPERLARFEREAKLLAQLHHSNIASIFGLEECDGIRALVMELVDGPTLAERLGEGPLSLEESLSVARQVAEALEAAHAKGIVHRDLKPQNIKAPLNGTVKVLDFGLAKAMAAPGAAALADLGSAALMNSPTMTVRDSTRLGVILGTAAYMSPEQARGNPVDKRADIWAFGVVLFEMLSGRRLFAADTASDTLAAVLKTEIDFTALPPSIPAALRDLLRRCLERNIRNRLHDIADARLVLDDLIAGRLAEETAPAAHAAPRRWATAAWVIALVVVGAASALAAFLASRRAPAPAAEPLRLSMMLAPDQELVYGANGTLAFAPDGGSLVFSGRMKGRAQLFRRDLAGREAVPIPGTEDGDSAFFSPDGQWIGFVAGGNIMKVAAEGGRPFRLAGQLGVGGSAWLRDGTLVFNAVYSDGLFQVSTEGGTPKRLTTPDRAAGELGHWWPEELPGGQRIVFTAFRTPVDESRIGVLDLATGKVSWVVDRGFFGRYVPTGHLIYAQGQRLYAVPFDPATATVTGAAVAVVDDLYVSQTNAYGAFAVSSRGMLAYVTESLGNPLRELVWLDRAGRATPATGERRRFLSVSLSPDDQQAALTILGENRDVWVASVERGTLSRLTSAETTELDPVWSRDGRELYYIFDRPPFELRRIPIDAPDKGRPIWSEPGTLDTTGAAVSPDGGMLAFELSASQTGRDLLFRPLDGSAPPRPIQVSRSDERNVSFSPDGRWVAYQSNEIGRFEIYAQPFPGPGNRIQVSTDGGTDPIWARNGEIFYLHDDELRVVPARPTGRTEFEAPRPLFSYPLLPSSTHEAQTFDVTRDGARIIAVVIPEARRPRQLEIVTSWTSALERMAPRAR
jgi:Tol biopolymer transport system component